MKTISLLALSAVLMLSTSCGKKKSGDGSNPPLAEIGNEEAAPQMEEVTPQPLEGKYEAILRPLNTAVSGFLPSGRAKVEILQDTVSVTTFLEDDSRVMHIQSIHEGHRCPNLSDDSNGDGFIDILEMKKATGNVLIPLDGDLNSQLEGMDDYPMGKKFTYKKVGTATNMLNDLYTNDVPENSGLTKLSEGAPLNLEGRVVIIHGTADLSRVPETVQTTSDSPRNVTIPITCGIIKRKQ